MLGWLGLGFVLMWPAMFPAQGVVAGGQGSVGEPLKVRGGVMAGRLIEHREPVYPEAARAVGSTGTVALRAIISETGHVESLQTLSGPPLLAEAVVAAVKEWIYKPYLVNGAAVRVDTTVMVTLRADGSTAMMPQGGVMGGLGPARSLPLDTFCGSEVPGEPGFHVRVSSGVMAGQIISRPDPVSTPAAREAHISGAVVMKVCVSRRGTVENVEVISGPQALRKDYVDAVSRWRYRPYLLNGEAVPVETTVTFTMQFGGGV